MKAIKGKLKISKREQKIILKYYGEIKKNLKKIQEEENSELDKDQLDMICEIEFFKNILNTFEKKEEQWKEKVDEEIKMEFLYVAFSKIVAAELEGPFQNESEKQKALDKKIQGLIDRFNLYSLLRIRLNSLFIDYIQGNKAKFIIREVEIFFENFGKKISSLERNKRIFFYYMVKDQVFETFEKIKGTNPLEIQAFNEVVKHSENKYLNF